MMNITIATIISEVKKHLSTIGKRLYTQDGRNMFADITLSSAEESILAQYVTESAQDIEAVLKQFITSSTYSNTSISFIITNNRGDIDFESRAGALAQTYIVNNVLGEYLGTLHPDVASKYRESAQQRMEALVAYVVYKKAPSVSVSSMTDATGTVTN